MESCVLDPRKGLWGLVRIRFCVPLCLTCACRACVLGRPVPCQLGKGRLGGYGELGSGSWCLRKPPNLAGTAEHVRTVYARQRDL